MEIISSYYTDFWAQVFRGVSSSDIKNIEMVCRTFRKIVREKKIWECLCTQANLPVPQNLQPMTNSKICKAIYYSVHEDIYLKCQELSVTLGNKLDLNNKVIGLLSRWGNNDLEPFVKIHIRNKRKREDAKNSPQSKPTYLSLGYPTEIPLRLFINKDGSFKNTNEKIYIFHNNIPIILRCMNTIGHNSFRESLNTHVNCSLNTFTLITQGDLDLAKTLAMTTTKVWQNSN